jgi:hypothetical protein
MIITAAAAASSPYAVSAAPLLSIPTFVSVPVHICLILVPVDVVGDDLERLCSVGGLGDLQTQLAHLQESNHHLPARG